MTLNKESKKLMQKQMTKKELREYFAKQRVTAGKPTGTIVMQTEKVYSRKRNKEKLKKELARDNAGSFFSYSSSAFSTSSSAASSSTLMEKDSSPASISSVSASSTSKSYSSAAVFAASTTASTSSWVLASI